MVAWVRGLLSTASVVMLVACGSRMERGHPPDWEQPGQAARPSDDQDTADQDTTDQDADDHPPRGVGGASPMMLGGRPGAEEAGAPAAGGASSEAGAAGNPSETGDAGAGGGEAAAVSIEVISEPVLTVHEWYGSAHFHVVLGAAPTANVSVGISSSDVAHATAKPSALLFTPQNWDVPQVVTVAAVDDQIRDSDHSVSIHTLAAVSDDERYDGLNAVDVPILVWDDTDTGIVVQGSPGYTAENGTSATFSIVLNSKPTAAVQFSLTSSNPNEGTVQDSLEIVPDLWNKPHKVVVTGVDDDLPDGAQPYEIIIGAAESDDPHYTGIVPTRVKLTNHDNE